VMQDLDDDERGIGGGGYDGVFLEVIFDGELV